MKGRFLFLAAALALGACTPDVVHQARSGDPVCVARAGVRADDAANAGYDRGLQEKVRAYAYKDCLVWAARTSTAGFR